MNRPTYLITFNNLVKCKIIRRVNRFTVLATSDKGQKLAVHNTNTGKLTDVLVPEAEAYCMPLQKPGKTNARLIAVAYGNGYAVVDTRSQEDAFISAINSGKIGWAKQCTIAKRHVRIGSSRIDFLAKCSNGEMFIETKSAILRSADGGALYPDTPSQRGRRHIEELMRLAESGLKAVLVFVAAFTGALYAAPNRQVDPFLADMMSEAARKGVLVKAIGIDFDPKAVSIRLYSDDLPVTL